LTDLEGFSLSPWYKDLPEPLPALTKATFGERHQYGDASMLSKPAAAVRAQRSIPIDGFLQSFQTLRVPLREA